MSQRNRRYLFVDYDYFVKLNTKKLQQICDRLFVFVPANHDNIPLYLVQQTQKLGKFIKWVDVVKPGPSMDVSLVSFYMGRFHEKLQKDIEFGIVSNEEYFDALIAELNASGRKSLRLRIRESLQEG